MKTTLELPDALFRRAKAAAATQGIPLRQLVQEALEGRLRVARSPSAAPAWKRLHGGLASLRAETRRIGRTIEDTFEVVDDEDS
jgi:hypothetical protein